MNCQQARDLLNEYMDGVLDDAARAALEEHLERCEACRRAELQMRAVWAALDHWVAPGASAEFRERFWERAERTQRARRRRVLILSPIAAAAAALIMLALVLPFRQQSALPLEVGVEEVLGLDDMGVIHGMRVSEQLEALQVLESLNAEDWAYVTGGNSS